MSELAKISSSYHVGLKKDIEFIQKTNCRSPDSVLSPEQRCAFGLESHRIETLHVVVPYSHPGKDYSSGAFQEVA